MAHERIKNFADLLNRFDALVESAEAGPVEPEVVDYLRQTRTRIVHLRGSLQDGGRRESPRHPESGQGRLVVGDQALTVSIVDVSDTGFGVLSPQPVEADTAVRLDLDGEQDLAMYEALVTYCAPEGEHFRLGLDIFSSLRID
jgi:hypothetical protein